MNYPITQSVVQEPLSQHTRMELSQCWVGKPVYLGLLVSGFNVKVALFALKLGLCLIVRMMGGFSFDDDVFFKTVQ